MATYTAAISACTEGNHIIVNLKRNGVAFKRICYEKDKLLDPNEINWEDVLVHFMRQAIKAAGATTAAQAKAAVEAATWVF